MLQDLFVRISPDSLPGAASGLDAVSTGIIAASNSEGLGSIQSVLESFSFDPASIDIWGDPNIPQPSGWAGVQEPASALNSMPIVNNGRYSSLDVARNLEDQEFNQGSVLSDFADDFFGNDQGKISNLLGQVFGNLVPGGADDVTMNPQPLPPKESLDDAASRLSNIDPGGPNEQSLVESLREQYAAIRNLEDAIKESVSLQQDFRFRGGFMA